MKNNSATAGDAIFFFSSLVDTREKLKRYIDTKHQVQLPLSFHNGFIYMLRKVIYLMSITRGVLAQAPH